MRHLRLWLMPVILLALLTPSTGGARTPFAIGQRIELRAFKPQGVPLHREPRASLFGRAPDGSHAVIQAFSPNERWLQIQLDADQRTAWIVRKYVRRVLEALPGDGLPGDTATVSEIERQVWSSAHECEQAVAAGHRMAPPQPDVMRLATWNIRWFPDGSPTRSTDPSANNQPTDLAWLACTLAWLNADVVALQEIRRTSVALDAWEVVLDSLQAFTGALWLVDLQTCGGPDAQHVGFLWNTTRVRLSDPQDIWQLNGRAQNATQACHDRLRPGRHVFLKSASPQGVDVHLVAVHFDSGKEALDHTTRRTSFERIDEAVAPFLAADADVIILGDLNTMGQDGGETAAEEIASVETLVQSEAPGFRLIEAQPACSEYFQNKAGLLDHLIVATDMQEAPQGPSQVTGYCAVNECADLHDLPQAYRFLSDHCPVVYAIRNQDQD